MSTLALNAFLTKALLDDKFQNDILSGQGLKHIHEFDLSSDEKNAVLSIKAENVKQFIHEVNQWMSAFEVSHSSATTKPYDIPGAVKSLCHPQAHCEQNHFQT